MKKVVVFVFSLLCLSQAWAQQTDSAKTKKSKKDWSKVSLANRPKDHFLFQVGYGTWTKAPDTLQTKGVPLSYNFYLMLDFPFKTDPRWSVGLGAGVAFDNKGFENTEIDVSGKKADKLGFYNVKDTLHFKKYKLVNSFLEAPVELRYSSNPEQNLKSWKMALGVKVGTMLGAGTRGKTLVNSAGNTVNAYVQKERAKRYFNTTRLSVMGRVGYGIVSVYAAYQINSFIKEGFGPDVRPLQIGITISGL